MERHVGDERPVRTIVRAVADANGVDPLELPPLGRRIDADALDRLLATGHGDRAAENGGNEVTVTFEYANCEVRATPSRVTVEQT